MQPESDTALKRLYESVLVLASDEGKIEKRLEVAFFDYLHTIEPRSLPAEVRTEWQSILGELREMYPERGTALMADSARAVDLAQRILLVYDSMIR